MKSALKAAGAALLATLAAQQALAWDGITYGTIIGVEVNGSTTRIYMTGHPVMCNGGNRYAYITVNDGNYNAYVSTALSAMAMKTPMSVYTYTQGGQCFLATLVAGSSPF